MSAIDDVAAIRANHIAVTVDSLRDVRAMISDVPDEQFNMEHWWLEDGMAFDEDRNVMYKVADGPCGCVIGHLIQRGLLTGDILKPENIPGALPYQFRDRLWVQISDALKLYNYQIAEWMFSQYSYAMYCRPIKKQDVIRRIDFVISELVGEK